jgi:AraC family transcriptional regulator of adaptative response/methylated-DNA-[protein]-cysteine methyltransferase
VRRYLDVMNRSQMPSEGEMFRALVARDSSYDGVFYIAVVTTGIFCRPTCPARKPKRENVVFYRHASEAVAAGFRPCARCRPLEPNGEAPSWLKTLLREIERDPLRRVTDRDLRDLSIDPTRVRRWFRSNFGMTFHAYQRARRLALAFGQLKTGGDITGTAFDHGYESLSGFRDAFGRIFGDAPGRGRSGDCVLTRRLLTPLGPMIAAATDAGVCLLEFADRRMLDTQITRLRKHLGPSFAPGVNKHLERLEEELKGYFDGSLRRFTVPLVIPGTDFQLNVWKQLQEIPYGQTVSYEHLARLIGTPSAQRAVGRANGDNRIAIVIPCHRVVRADGELSGYGGGVWRKRRLLEHESAVQLGEAQTPIAARAHTPV